MTTFRGIGTAAAASLLLLTAACAQGADAADPEGGSDLFAGDTAVLRVEHTGGFVTPDMLATRLPLVTVYGDGRIITEGPQLLIYPGPALPNLQVQRIAPEHVDTLLALALTKLAETDGDFGEPPIADAASTRFTVATAHGAEVVEVYALGEADGDVPGLNRDQVAARGALRELLAALTDLSATLGSGTAGEAEPYQPTAVAAVATPYDFDDPDLGEQPELAWPGPELPGAALNADLGLHCVLVTGDELDDLLAAAGSANVLTPWTSGGSRWAVNLRPLLPDESSCADLGSVS